MIRVDRLSKTFRVHRKEAGLAGSLRSLFLRRKFDKPAVRQVSFGVGEGEVVGLVGANGAGKTTLVKMLAGIVHPTSGDARVLGHRPWERDNALRRRIALIMGQKAQLWWDLPAADGFLLLRQIYGVPKRRFDERLAYLAELLEVKDELEVQVRRLSLGERMKMELIAALLHSPRVVYLDEPTIGLDLGAQRAIREFLLAYRREESPAMIVTSHYMEDIERLCERILILRRGRLVYDGSRRRVAERFARHKRITVHVRTRPDAATRQRLAEIGRLVDPSASDAGGGDAVGGDAVGGDAVGGDGPGADAADSGHEICLEVPRQEVTAAAARALELLEAVDLSIEEEPLGNIIERLQRARGEDDDGEDVATDDAGVIPP